VRHSRTQVSITPCRFSLKRRKSTNLNVLSIAMALLFGLAAMAATLSSSVSAAATSGDFNILSFNVAGLPAILNDNAVPGDKATNAGTIGSLFAKYDYDVIHVQEDMCPLKPLFNHVTAKTNFPEHFNYHAYIYATDDHPYRTATSGGAAIGSGLNTLSNFDWIDFAREKWGTCSDASGADCLTPKGFTFMRLILEEGVYIDFYNLHADAGFVVPPQILLICSFFSEPKTETR
jgi:hypothetical protein